MRIILMQPSNKDLAAYGTPGLTDGIVTPFWNETEPTQGNFVLDTFKASLAAMPETLGIVIAATAGNRVPAWLADLADAEIAHGLFLAPAYHQMPRHIDVTAPYTPGYVSAYLAMHQALHDAMTPAQLARVSEVKPTIFGWLDNELQIPWCSGKAGNSDNAAIWQSIGFSAANLLDMYLYVIDALRGIWGSAVTIAQASWKPQFFLPCCGAPHETEAEWLAWVEAAADGAPYQIIDTALGSGDINGAFLQAKDGGVTLAFQTQATLGSRDAILAAVKNGLTEHPPAIEFHAGDIVQWPDIPAAVATLAAGVLSPAV